MREAGARTERTVSLAPGSDVSVDPAWTSNSSTFLSNPPTTSMSPLAESATQRTRASRVSLTIVVPVDMSKSVTSCCPTTAMRSAASNATPPCCAGQLRTASGSQLKAPPGLPEVDDTQ